MSFSDSLHALFRDGDAAWGFLTAALLVLGVTPLVARLAPRIGGVDDKHDRPRVHGDRPIPRIGGLAIVVGIAVPMIAFLRPEGHYLGILLGTLLVAALGLIDDIRGIKPSIKMLGIVTAALILDTSFVVLKRLKYGRAPWNPDHNHFYHRFMRIGFSQRRTAAYLHVLALLLAGYAILLRFVPPRPRGNWDLRNALIATGVGLVVLAASVWMVYTLEILKSRHLRLLRLGGPPDVEPEEAVERALSAGRR